MTVLTTVNAGMEMEGAGSRASGGKSATPTWKRRDTCWRVACIRGATWGLVLGLHGLLLMALLHSDGLRPAITTTPETAATPMLLQLLRTPTSSRATPTSSLRLPARRPKRPTRPTPTFRTLLTAPVTSAAAMTPPLPPHAPNLFAAPAASSSTYEMYQSGGFREALRDAQHGAQTRLPGSDAALVEGLRLKPVVSARDVVRTLSKASLCSAESFKMQHQDLSPQDMDRLLEADGCGAHADKSPAVDAAVERATQQAIQHAFPGQ